jgi:endonuclease/exonuclease/phosphatase family metal-dependent hydrolase
MNRHLYPIAAVIVLAAACKDPFEVRPGSLNWLTEQRVSAGASEITVMTQNLYVGADVDAVIGALASPDPNDDVPALLFAIQTLGKTDFPARADAVADAIARARPHVVGLQEVSVINIDLTGLGLPVVVHLDFLAILQTKLAERGLHYDLAAQVQNITAVPLPGISLVDHDAILVDADRVTIASAGGQNFAVNIGVVAPGVDLKRGWVWARTMIDGQAYTFVSLHAEADLAGAHLDGLRALQISEVVGTVSGDARVVMMGDFNDTPGSLMHQVLTGAGFTDVWAALRPGVIGFTCCHLPDLSDKVAPFSQRIDYVLARGLGGPRGVRGKVDRFGDVPADRLPGPAHPIWPSDHVGVTATLR